MWMWKKITSLWECRMNFDSWQIVSVIMSLTMQESHKQEKEPSIPRKGWLKLRRCAYCTVFFVRLTPASTARACDRCQWAISNSGDHVPWNSLKEAEDQMWWRASMSGLFSRTNWLYIWWVRKKTNTQKVGSFWWPTPSCSLCHSTRHVPPMDACLRRLELLVNAILSTVYTAGDVTAPTTSIPLAPFTDPSGVSDDGVPLSSVHVFPVTGLSVYFTRWWGIKGNLVSKQGWWQMEITSFRDVSQLCTKQVGTGEVFK